jgi:hypothetical protein
MNSGKADAKKRGRKPKGITRAADKRGKVESSEEKEAKEQEVEDMSFE